MAYKKSKFHGPAQVGNYVKYNGKKYEVYTIDPENNTFSIEVNGKIVELDNDGDFEIWEWSS